MPAMSMSAFTTTGFYFSAFLFWFAALLLAALYHYRWKSERLSVFLWLITFVISGLSTWLITGHTMAVFFAVGFNLLLAIGLQKLVHTISQFGVFFLISMITPSLYGIIWIFELFQSANHHLNAGWLLSVGLLFAGVIFSILILFNTAMWAWIVLVRYSELYFHFPRLQATRQKSQAPLKNYPWVSLHVPCYAEPPEIVIQTLDALARLQYPHFEVIVLDNNTEDSQLWKPLETHCKELGERFHFFHYDSLKGAKAGALNMALYLTSPQVEIIGVIDADYVAQPDFLEKLVGLFDDPKTGFVQSCQDYRDWQKSPFQSACYFEYQTHFKLELPGQNEWDVTYTIGTMCLIRRQALEKVGKWSEWCLTEDSEVAVRLHALGYAGYYLKNTFGYGLIPETFESYKRQRFRWTAGPVQQFQKHWRLYLPWFAKGRLTLIQKFGEIFHSLSVFFAEALNNLMNIPVLGLCLWYAIQYQHHFVLPWIVLLLIPLTILRNILCNWIHIRLLGGSWQDYLLSAIAGRSLIYTRNMAFYKALFSKKLAWKRTDKFKVTTNFQRALASTRDEIIFALIYLCLAGILTFFVSFRHPDIIFLIWLGMINQTLSFLCAPFMAFLSEYAIKNKLSDSEAKVNLEGVDKLSSA